MCFNWNTDVNRKWQCLWCVISYSNSLCECKVHNVLFNIVPGSIFIDDCPASNRIPIWLIVFGCVSLLQTFVNICKRCIQQVTKKSGEEEEERSNSVSRGGGCIESFLSGFLFVWIIVGSVWVFSLWDDYQIQGIAMCPDCCHQTVYLFSFSVLLIIYSFGALCCCCFCCCFCGIVCLSAANGDDS